MNKPLIFLGMVVCFSMSTMAQSPNLFNYQAVARQSDGTPLANQTIGIRISILEGSDSGAIMFSEEHEPTTNDYGLFSLVIGKGSGEQKLADINWNSGNEKWMQVELDASLTGDYILLGSSQLVSVPYALFANEAGSSTHTSTVVESMSEEERGALSDPPGGLLIFNTSTQSLNIFMKGDWWEVEMSKIQEPWQCGRPFRDIRDGKEYETVLIGSKCWMAENLNAGEMILLSTGASNNSVIEKYCYDNNEANCQLYGGLYAWSEMMQYSKTPGIQGICPPGWHLPSDQEWQEIEIALGMSPADAAASNTWRGSDQGARLRIGGSSGYNVAYSGRAVPGFGFTAKGSFEYVWTSTESGLNAWRRCMDVTSDQIGRYDTFPKTYGMSVRCVR